jgi:hypothetical protein
MPMKRNAGRKPHRPTAATRKLVSALVVNGVPQSRIVLHIGVSEKTLRARYGREISLATEALCGKAVTNLARLMGGTGHAAVQACKFALTCKGGWRDDALERGVPGLIERMENEEANARDVIARKLDELAARRARLGDEIPRRRSTDA